MMQEENKLKVGNNLAKIDPIKIYWAVLICFLLSGLFAIGNTIMLWNVLTGFGKGQSIIGVFTSLFFALFFYQYIVNAKKNMIKGNDIEDIFKEINSEEVKQNENTRRRY